MNADSLATAAAGAGQRSVRLPIRLNLQVEDETRTRERLRRGEVVGAVSIQPQALPSCPVDQLGRSITCLSHQKSLRNAISRMA